MSADPFKNFTSRFNVTMISWNIEVNRQQPTLRWKHSTVHTYKAIFFLNGMDLFNPIKSLEISALWTEDHFIICKLSFGISNQLNSARSPTVSVRWNFFSHQWLQLQQLLSILRINYRFCEHRRSSILAFGFLPSLPFLPRPIFIPRIPKGKGINEKHEENGQAPKAAIGVVGLEWPWHASWARGQMPIARHDENMTIIQDLPLLNSLLSSALPFQCKFFSLKVMQMSWWGSKNSC